jgi:hypothetical protein
MFELDPIIKQVLRNCDISDSGHSGMYTVCGLALRLRDLYKWEKRLPPWQEHDSKEILEWIDNKERLWDELSEEDFDELAILGDKYDPFDTTGINAILEPRGLFYGAGYGRSLKPTFFLASIEDKTDVDGHAVYTLSRDVARDLLTIPALVQDNTVILRKERAMFFLWNQMFYIKESGRHALRFGLKACGYPHTPVELLARAVKDLIADTNEFGALRHITRERKTASLAFYVAFFDGLSKELFPELRNAFRGFSETHDWQIIEQAVSKGHSTAKEHAELIIDIFRAGKDKNGKEWAKEEIEKRILGGIKGK